jgi:transcriptional regulator with XRE-family HTH domain
MKRDDYMELGRRIRRLRKEQKRTLNEIADICGFTVSLLSKIETDKTTPPVATLVKIADALGVKVSELLEENTQIGTIYTPKEEVEKAEWVKTNKGYSFFAFATALGDKLMQPYLFHAKKGEVKEHVLSHEGEEFVFMLEGEMKYRVGNVEYTLKPGDSVYFNSLEDHMLTPITEEAKYFAVFTNPE